MRKEGAMIEGYKLKNLRFLEAESKSLDRNEVDIETEQTIENEPTNN